MFKFILLGFISSIFAQNPINECEILSNNPIFGLTPQDVLQCSNSFTSPTVTANNSIISSITLDITDNSQYELSSIPEEVYRLRSLHTLIFNGFSITNLTFQNFQSATSLRVLSLAGTINNIIANQQQCEIDICHDEPSLFSSLTGLNSLNLRDSALQLLPGNTFANLTNLTELNLQNNNFIKLPKLSGLSNLQVLEVQNNYIFEIPENAFISLGKLKTVDFSNNFITNLGNALAGLKLETLRLSFNEIANITKGSLGDFSSLVLFEMTNNLISNLPVGFFNNATVLSDLYFQYNKLETLPEGLLNDCVSLERIDFSDNLIKSIPDNFFERLPRLLLLSLLNNHLEKVPSRNNKLTTLPATFKNLTAITELDLSYNQLTELPELVNIPIDSYLFIHNNALTKLPLFNPEITFLHLSYNNFQFKPNEKPFEKYEKLSSLFLRNALGFIPNTLLVGPKSLMALDLSRNGIKVIPDSLFDPVPDLNTLYLHENQLETLESRTFNSISNLAYLLLGNNLLKSLPNDIFSKFKYLFFLDLHSNKFEKLDSEILNPLNATLTDFYLFNNTDFKEEIPILSNFSSLVTCVVQELGRACKPANSSLIHPACLTFYSLPSCNRKWSISETINHVDSILLIVFIAIFIVATTAIIALLKMKKKKSLKRKQKHEEELSIHSAPVEKKVGLLQLMKKAVVSPHEVFVSAEEVHYDSPKIYKFRILSAIIITIVFIGYVFFEATNLATSITTTTSIMPYFNKETNFSSFDIPVMKFSTEPLTCMYMHNAEVKNCFDGKDWFSGELFDSTFSIPENSTIQDRISKRELLSSVNLKLWEIENGIVKENVEYIDVLLGNGSISSNVSFYHFGALNEAALKIQDNVVKYRNTFTVNIFPAMINVVKFQLNVNRSLTGGYFGSFDSTYKDRYTYDLSMEYIISPNGETIVRAVPKSFDARIITETRNYTVISLLSAIATLGSTAAAFYVFLYGAGPFKPWGIVQEKIDDVEERLARVKQEKKIKGEKEVEWEVNLFLDIPTKVKDERIEKKINAISNWKTASYVNSSNVGSFSDSSPSGSIEGKTPSEFSLKNMKEDLKRELKEEMSRELKALMASLRKI
ncbi:hypothetical protein HDU92_007960 [Lobulomyces angularis]|nr:hypothetical protein HDU92_007960 [Lobulomyces angularis]